MRIDAIEVKNFRGIRELSLRDLQSTVVIAGANGSGKSCIFDAIRLLKSAYGGYQPNEWHQWMAEFQINFANSKDAIYTFFQDRTKELSIKIKFRLHQDERKYIEVHGKELVRHSVWRLIAPELYGWTSYRAAPMAAQYRSREPEVAAQTEVLWKEVLRELSQETIHGHLWASFGSDLQFQPSKALEILFTSYMPGELGLVDYHGPQRMYTRENISTLNLDLNVQEQQSKQHALYNYNNKYGNVKSEMAASYVKELLAASAGVRLEDQRRISNTLTELFATFFPDKEFLGPTPTIDGALTFPVRTATGSVHDLNELSAGEKEVLYGYLRIRNSAPRYSIILIDEPELHLNPRLVRGLPQFYHQHLGLALDNQIWLITHSDTLLREVVGRPEYSVYHMVGATVDPSAPQIVPLTPGEEVQRAIMSLVGDIAAYRPGKKVIIFEGGGDSEFDVYCASQLFPELSGQTNLISSGNKLRVRELHAVLDAANEKGHVPFKVFSITDGDSEVADVVAAPRFKWDVYHIENYLLDPAFVLKVLADLNCADMSSESEVYDELRAAASATMKELIRHEIVDFANKAIVSAIDFGFDPKRTDIAKAVSEAITRSADRIERARAQQLTLGSLSEKEGELELKFQRDLATDAWRKSFRGRDILRNFAQAHTAIPYEVFRDLIVARMKDAGHKPSGMKAVIDAIIAA